MSSGNAIAMLDSGVGGLTVVKEIMTKLPNERIVYFGDTARMPYGPREHTQVRGFACQIIEFLRTQAIKMVIVACNSATAAGLAYYQEHFPLPIIGVIEPGVSAALKSTANGRIGVIGTTGTISSGAYEKAIKKIAPDVTVISQACPLFVLIVENNLAEAPETYRVAEEYLAPLRRGGVDTLILGCTHYPLLAPVIQQVMGDKVKLISSAEETALQAREILGAAGLCNSTDPKAGTPEHLFFVSGLPAAFEEIGEKLLGKKINTFRVVL